MIFLESFLSIKIQKLKVVVDIALDLKKTLNKTTFTIYSTYNMRCVNTVLAEFCYKYFNIPYQTLKKGMMGRLEGSAGYASSS